MPFAVTPHHARVLGHVDQLEVERVADLPVLLFRFRLRNPGHLDAVQLAVGQARPLHRIAGVRLRSKVEVDLLVHGGVAVVQPHR